MRFEEKNPLRVRYLSEAVPGVVTGEKQRPATGGGRHVLRTSPRPAHRLGAGHQPARDHRSAAAEARKLRHHPVHVLREQGGRLPPARVHREESRVQVGRRQSRYLDTSVFNDC